METLYTLLNLEWKKVKILPTDMTKYIQKEIGGNFQILYMDNEIEIFVDESGLLKQESVQNESLAYLMYSINRYIGLLYGIWCYSLQNRKSSKENG